MDATQTNRLASEQPTQVPVPAAATGYAQCDECGAAVDHDQRYCVNCGAHRRHVNDPAARYLSRTTARSRTAPGPVPDPARQGPGATRRLPSLALAALLAVIPAGVAVGVVVGRSSNNGDAQLIRELSRSQAQLAAASRASVAGSTTAASTPIATTTQTSAAGHKRAAKHTSSTKRGAAKHARSTANPNAKKAPKNLNSKPTASQQQQGATIVNKLQHTNGTSYLNQLPSQVVVP